MKKAMILTAAACLMSASLFVGCGKSEKIAAKNISAAVIGHTETLEGNEENSRFVKTTDAIKCHITAEGCGQFAIAEDGEEPEFDPECPLTDYSLNLTDPDTVCFYALGDDGWKFVKWMKDGQVISEESVVTVNIDASAEYTAVFEKASESHIQTTDNIQAHIAAEGSGQFAVAMADETPVFNPDYPLTDFMLKLGQPDTYKLCAKADDGAKFVKWMKDGQVISTDEIITVDISDSAEYTAVFAEA